METYGRPVLCFECQGIAFDDILRDAVASSPGSPQWNRKDTLPDLPTLTASASAGCTFCRHLKFTIEEKLPLQLQSALTRTRPGSVITVCLGSPAYVLRSEVQEVRPGWENVDHREEPDGLYWLSLIFHHESWDAPWEVRAWVYAGTGASSIYWLLSGNSKLGGEADHQPYLPRRRVETSGHYYAHAGIFLSRRRLYLSY
jgi:hypothetical protein